MQWQRSSTTTRIRDPHDVPSNCTLFMAIEDFIRFKFCQHSVHDRGRIIQSSHHMVVLLSCPSCFCGCWDIQQKKAKSLWCAFIPIPPFQSTIWHNTARKTCIKSGLNDSTLHRLSLRLILFIVIGHWNMRMPQNRCFPLARFSLLVSNYLILFSIFSVPAKTLVTTNSPEFLMSETFEDIYDFCIHVSNRI